MFQIAIAKILSKLILKKGGINALLWFGDLMVKITKTKKDDKAWKKVRPLIEEFK